MTGSSLSSTTTTSHTLSADPPRTYVGMELQKSSDPILISTLKGSPHTFLQPTPSLHFAALVHAKGYLDSLASAVTNAQQARRDAVRKKRKRGETNGDANGPLLQINKIYLEGFEIEQVWEQARRVLDATVDSLEEALPALIERSAITETGSTAQNGNSTAQDGESQLVRFDEDGFEIGSSEGSSEGEESDMEADFMDEMLGRSSEEVDDVSVHDEDKGESSDIEDEDEDDVDKSLVDEHPGGSESDEEEPTETFVQDPNGLNDGFFSIDTFNAQAQLMERRDVAGEPFDDSDADEIDWDQDPMTMRQNTVRKDKSGKVSEVGARDDNDNDDELEEEEEEEEVQEEEEGGEDEDEGGPTFGNMILNAPEGASDDEMEGEGGDEEKNGYHALDNTNDVLYKDFFEPPPRKAGTGKGRPSRHTREMNAERERARATRPELGENEDDDLQRTMEAVRRDLFEDEMSANEVDSDADLPKLDPADPKARRSTHERRQYKIAEEIRKLEAANVAKREWVLSGEARASDRPMNSLLEEDLDFERAGKPIPVITAAVSEDIEEMIKRRILAREFDEVIRRRPDDLATGGTRRGRFELDDNKAKQSLAEIYEEEHLRKVDPEGHKDQKDATLEKEHREIENLWTEISAKLDALSSWHYKPKPPKPSINIVADVPTVAMEDAQPTAAVGTGGELGSSSMLAPQEIYTPGKESAAKGEVVPKSGLPVSKSELTREEKLRRRRREKERIKKSSVDKGSEQKKSRLAQEKSDVKATLKKGGVRIIGKKGELRDMDGDKIKDVTVGKGGGNYKL